MKVKNRKKKKKRMNESKEQREKKRVNESKEHTKKENIHIPSTHSTQHDLLTSPNLRQIPALTCDGPGHVRCLLIGTPGEHVRVTWRPEREVHVQVCMYLLCALVLVVVGSKGGYGDGCDWNVIVVIAIVVIVGGVSVVIFGGVIVVLLLLLLVLLMLLLFVVLLVLLLLLLLL